MFKKILLLIAGLYFLSAIFVYLFWRIPFAAKPPIYPVYILNENKLWDLIQSWRVENKLQPYIKSQELCDYILIRLPQIKKNFNHDGFMPLIKSITNVTKFTEIAENLSEHHRSEQSVLDGWLDSPSHSKNLKYPYLYSCIKTDKDFAVQWFANY